MNYITSRHKSYHNLHLTHYSVDYQIDNEELFGPNYKTLINFWIYRENLNEQKFKKYWKVIYAMDWEICNLARQTAFDGKNQVVQGKLSLDCIECEIVASHFIKKLTFLPIFMSV
jgi:hypothetical protein